MCNSDPSIPCLRAHHVPVMIQVWDTSEIWTTDLVLATRTDLDDALAIAHSHGGCISIITDWETGEITHYLSPKKRNKRRR